MWSLQSSIKIYICSWINDATIIRQYDNSDALCVSFTAEVNELKQRLECVDKLCPKAFGFSLDVADR